MRQKVERQERFFLISLFIVALLVRLGFMFFLKHNYFFYANPSSDVAYYQEWARDIASGNIVGNKAFFGLPLYPYFLAVLFRLSLGNIEVMRFFHLLMGSLNCLLLFGVAKKLFSRRTAVLAAVFMCFNFFMIYYDWLMMPVTLIICLSLIIIHVLQNRAQFSLIRHWVILGALIGLTILGDGKFLFFLALTSAWLWFKEPERRKYVFVMILSALTVLGVCALRNKIISGDWILISAQSGLSFYAGNNPNATGTYSNPKFIRPTHRGQDEDQKIVAEAIVNRSMSAGEISAFWSRKAMRFITQHPGDYCKLLFKKWLLFFQETEDAHDMDLIFLREWKYRLNWNPLAFCFPMALIGIWVSFRHWRSRPFVLFVVVCQVIMTLIFFLSTRHRATMMPFLFIFQAAAILWFIKQFRQARFFSIIASAVFIAVFAMFFHPVFMNERIIEYNRAAKAGTVYDQRGDLVNAKRNYFDALNYVPADTSTLYNLGNIYVQEENWEQAREMYQSALKTCSYNIDALYNLAYVYEQQGDPDAAFALYHKVLKSQPDMPDVYFRMASLYDKLGQCDQAIPLYRKVLQLKPILADYINPSIKNCTN